MLTYVDLPTPFRAFLREEFLHDLDPAFAGKLVEVEVFGVSSYRESVPVFNAISLAEGGTFHALPPHAFLFREDAAPLPLEALCYDDCPDEAVAAFEVERYLRTKTCRVWLPDPDDEDGGRAPVDATYLFTLDWYEDNLLTHGLRLDSGQLCLYPPHKVLFPVPENPDAADAALPAWKKLRTEWSVGGRRPRGRRVFVLGPSGSCKTPFARLLSEALGVSFLSASDGVAEVLAPIAHLKTDGGKQRFVEEAGRRSVEALRAEPDLVIAHLEARIGAEPVVVEGLRNPRDFAWLFDWRTDVVVLLERNDNPYVPSSFEAGLDAIDAQLTWETAIGLLDPARCLRYAHDVDDLEACVADLVARLAPTV